MDKTLEKRVEELEQMLFLTKNVLSFDEAVSYTHLDVYKRQKPCFVCLLRNIVSDDFKTAVPQPDMIYFTHNGYKYIY